MQALRSVVALVLIVCALPSIYAQGVAKGVVVSDSTGDRLVGAEVSVAGTTLHTTTGRDGSFTLDGVPSGATLVISYPGHKTIEQSVSGTDALAVHLASDAITMGTLSVTGAREGMSQAVAIQKAADNQIVIAAIDQFGPVAEGNVGEYLKFLPGVNVDYNVNDARGLSLRGLSTAFTIVAVDGTPMAGTSSIDDTRRFEFEQIAMNNVNNTELYKTMTPDLAAAATGGFVNFVTRSAFDHEETQRVNYDISFSGPSTNYSFSKQPGVWGHAREYPIRPNMEMNVARKVTDRLGVNFNYRLSEKYDDSPREELTWNTAATAPTVMTAPRLQQYNIRSEQKLTHREAFASKVDYLISDSTRLTIAGQWNWYDLNFTQRGPQLVLGTASTGSGDTFTSGTGAAIQNNVLYRNKYGTTYHLNGTLSQTFANRGKLSLTPYWSKADGQYRDTSKGFISSTPTIATSASTFSNFTLTGVRDLGTNPTITLTRAGAALPVDYIRSLENYTLTNTTGTTFQSRPWTAIDKKRGFRADYTTPLTLRVPLTVTTGYQYDTVDRSINRPDLRGNIPATTGAALTALGDPNYTKDVAFDFGNYQVVDPFKVWEAFKGNLTFLSANDYRWFAEHNKSAYLRIDQKPFPELLVIGGVRWEERDISGTGISLASARSKLAHIELNYANWYPSLSLRYTPKQNVVLRAGFSKTVGHPDYGDILPVINSEASPGARNGDITVPAPTLDPYFTNNYDVAAEFYMRDSGLFSVSFYHKDVRGFIISRSMTAAEITSISTDYGYNPAEFNTGVVKANGGKVKYDGVEVNYAQTLGWLPKPFNSLNVQANISYTHVKASDPDPYREIDTFYSALRAVAPTTANLVIGYRYGDFNTTITNNWVDESLYGGFVATNYVVGVANTANPALDTRLLLKKDEKLTTDVKVEYSFSKRYSAYFLVRNVFNSARKEFFQGYLPQYRDITLPQRYFEFGEPHLTFGMRGTF